MITKSEILWLASAMIVAALLLWAPATGSSDETGKEYLSVEEYIEQARPYLHLSCEGAWELAAMDADAYLEIVDKVSAISFLNHDLNIEEVYDHSAEEVEALRVDYYTEIGQRCKENPKKLLAGVVERSLLTAFNKVAPEAVED
jgi:hypothetical protein